MKVRTLLLGAAATLALSTAANAYDRQGWYIGLEGGWSTIDDTSATQVTDVDPPGGAVTVLRELDFDDGWGAFATIGYTFANHFRAELEFGYRENDFSSLAAVPSPAFNDGEFNEWSGMFNVLYDVPLGRWATFSIGAGAGGDYSNFERTVIGYDETDWRFAWQGVAGLTFGLSDRLDLDFKYRYLTVTGGPEFSGRATPLTTIDYSLDDVTKQTASVGLRYHFGARAEPPPPPPVAPPPPPVEAPKAPREFIVFFGHNKSNLTPEALDVVKQAAAAAKEYGSANITVTGHADRSGSPKYNEALSMRRATAVKGALTAEGIPDGSISTSAKGESDPMVQTDDGVREPQNRRVHINL